MKIKSYKKLFTALVFFMAVCLIPGMLFAKESEGQGEGETTEDGRKYSVECQEALVEAQRRWETNPEDLAAAREPLINFLKAPVEPIPSTFYQMLGQFWHIDEKNEKSVEEAQKIFKIGFEAFPEDSGMLFNYAVTTYELEHYNDAGPLFEKYYEMSEEHDIQYLEYAASAFYAADNLKEAKRVYVKIIGLVETPKDSWMQTIIGICQIQEDTKETEKYIRMALDYFPLEKKYWKLLAGIYGEKDDYTGVAAAYEIATRIKLPEDKSEWQNLIEIYNYLGLPLRSAVSIQMGLDLLAAASTEEEQQIKIAEAYARGARVDKAVSYLDSVIAKNPSYTLKIKKATILYEARRNEEAMAALEDCIAEKANAYDAYYMKGWVAWDMKDWDVAERAFEEASVSREETIRYYAENALEMLKSLEKAKSE